MAFTKIVGKVGIFRHTQTKFVVHEVRNTQQIIDSNGVLVEYNDGNYVWLFGRDLKDFFAANAVLSLVDVGEKLRVTSRGFGSAIVADQAYSAFLRIPMIVNNAAFKTATFGFPNSTTFVTTAASSYKVFGVINNCQAGRGVGGPAAFVAGGQIGYPHDTIASIGFPSAQRTARNASQIGAYEGSQVMYDNLYTHTMDRAQLLGTVVVAIPLGMTWEGFVSDVISKLNPDGRAEIESECRTKMLPLIPALKKACPLPMVYAPFELLANGEYRLVDPKAHVQKVWETGSDGAGLKRLSSTLRGGCTMNERGRLETCCDWVMPAWSNASSEGFSTFIHTAADNNSQLNAGTTDYSTLNNCATLFSTPYRSIDGVRLERVLGGASGVRLLDTGEATINTPADISSADIVSRWRGALRFAGTSSVFDSKVDPVTSQVETAAAKKSRLEALSATSSVESPFATRLTQWDMHGFSAGHGLLALVAALDGSSTDAAWLTPLWLNRLELDLAITVKQTGAWAGYGDCLLPDTDPLLIQ